MLTSRPLDARQAARRTSTQRLFALVGHERKEATLGSYVHVGLLKCIIPNTQNVKIPRSLGEHLLFDYLKNTKHSVLFLIMPFIIH